MLFRSTIYFQRRKVVTAERSLTCQSGACEAPTRPPKVRAAVHLATAIGGKNKIVISANGDLKIPQMWVPARIDEGKTLFSCRWSRVLPMEISLARGSWRERGSPEYPLFFRSFARSYAWLYRTITLPVRPARPAIEFRRHRLGVARVSRINDPPRRISGIVGHGRKWRCSCTTAKIATERPFRNIDNGLQPCDC